MQDVVDVGNPDANGGLANDMWGTVVDRDGQVCAVTFSGNDRGQQWPGSRVISAQKANTANAFSLPAGAGGVFDGLALSSANLYSAVQPGREPLRATGEQPGRPLCSLCGQSGQPRPTQ